MVDAMIVVGSPNSSNSQRLREVAERAGCPLAMLVNRGEDIDWTRYGAISTLGITAGASAPEVLVEEIIDAFAQHYGRHRRDGDHHGGRRVLSPAARIARRRCGVRSWRSIREVPEGRALRFRWRNTRSRDVLAFKGIAEGVENTNYYLHTSQGAFILTLYEKRVREDRIAVLHQSDGASRPAVA